MMLKYTESAGTHLGEMVKWSYDLGGRASVLLVFFCLLADLSSCLLPFHTDTQQLIIRKTKTKTHISW